MLVVFIFDFSVGWYFDGGDTDVAVDVVVVVVVLNDALTKKRSDQTSF